MSERNVKRDQTDFDANVSLWPDLLHRVDGQLRRSTDLTLKSSGRFGATEKELDNEQLMSMQRSLIIA
jgi:hypothetical protein